MRKSIASLRHRVKMCSQKDVVNDDGFLILNREGVLDMWASIEAKAASTFTGQGATTKSSRGKRTHKITTRYHRDLHVSNLAWLYEERRISAPRWFKILKVVQSETKGSEYFIFDCQLVERGDDLTSPHVEVEEPLNQLSPAFGLPDGVVL